MDVIILKDILLRGSKSNAPFVWCSGAVRIREDNGDKGVVKEVLFDHQGHVKSLSGKLHFNST